VPQPQLCFGPRPALPAGTRRCFDPTQNLADLLLDTNLAKTFTARCNDLLDRLCPSKVLAALITAIVPQPASQSSPATRYHPLPPPAGHPAHHVRKRGCQSGRGADPPLSGSNLPRDAETQSLSLWLTRILMKPTVPFRVPSGRFLFLFTTRLRDEELIVATALWWIALGITRLGNSPDQ